MKTPIVVYENGDVSIFRSVADAEVGLESIDVINDEYVAYDATGYLLDLKVISESRSAWFGFSKTYVNRVKIELAEGRPEHASDLEYVLKAFLQKLGVPEDWTRSASLGQLLDKTIESIGYG
ncbi:MAG: hypothetical protein LAT61_10520 [Alcanivorax sp.]|nr:hypothetical protein [Alcanivorax sp.]